MPFFYHAPCCLRQRGRHAIRVAMPKEPPDGGPKIISLPALPKKRSPSYRKDGATGNRTDLANSEKMAEWYCEELKFVKAWGTWIRWNGAVWQRDTRRGGYAQ